MGRGRGEEEGETSDSRLFEIRRIVGWRAIVVSSERSMIKKKEREKRTIDQ